MSYADLKPKETVDFVVDAPQIVGTGFENVYILGEIDSTTAIALGDDVYAKHRNIYPFIKDKPGVADNPDSYMYIRVKKLNGSVVILGKPWIREESIKVVKRKNISVYIPDVGTEDVNIVKAALESNGYPNAVVKLV